MVGKPATSMLSLTPKGTPYNGPLEAGGSASRALQRKRVVFSRGITRQNVWPSESVKARHGLAQLFGYKKRCGRSSICKGTGVHVLKGAQGARMLWQGSCLQRSSRLSREARVMNMPSS